MNGRRTTPGGDAESRLEVIASGSRSPDDMAALVLHELQAMLERLIETGEPSSIDLRRTALAPRDFETLNTVLGHGEVSATVASLGPTHIRETGVEGIWWLTHGNQDGRTMVELVEVTECPEPLKTRREDLPAGLERLRARLARCAHLSDHADTQAG